MTSAKVRKARADETGLKFLVPKPKKARKAATEVGDEADAVDNDEEEASFIIERSSDAESKVQKFIRTADAFASIFEVAPKTVQDWKKMSDVALANAPACPHVGSGKKYMRRWHVRMYLLCRMHERGIDKLKLGGCSLNSVVNLNPDETDCMIRLRSHLRQLAGSTPLTAAAFVKGLGAKRVELASMWSCFAMDVGFREEDFETFDESEWTKVAKEMKASAGVSPHLAARDPA
jgi:hypothetical protein